MNNLIKKNSHHSKRRYLAVCISAIISYTGGMSTSVDASDIEIYKSASAARTTLMLMLDLSGSMGSALTASGSSYSDDYGLTSCGTASQTTSPINGLGLSSFQNNTAYFIASTTSPSYSRNFCYVTTASASSNTLVKNNCEQVSGGYRCYDRITKLKDGLFDLLQGNSAKGVSEISEDKFIGLAVFSSNGNGRTGHIVIPARALSEKLSGVLSQRQALLNAIASMSVSGGTPTANAYAEVASYLLGTTTIDSVDQKSYPYTFVQNNNSNYHICVQWNGTSCADWGINYAGYASSMVQGLTPGTANVEGPDAGYKGTFYSQISTNGYSGFSYSALDAKKTSPTSYYSPLTGIVESGQKECSGQGIYVLTDGLPNSSSSHFAGSLMRQALGSSYASALSCSGTLFRETGGATGWSCISDMSQLLLGKNIGGTTTSNQTNPTGLTIKTAVVGFGRSFQVTSNLAYDVVKNSDGTKNETETIRQNINKINSISNLNENIKNTFLWGVYGQGGWYSGSNSQDIVDSVNSFLGELSSEVKPLTTGKVTIANDPLNPTKLENVSYYPQFQPKPNDDYQLWLGNLKKYNLNSIGSLDSARDLWALSSVASQDQGPSSLLGGVVDKLALGYRSDSTANRILYSNRDITKSSDNYNGNRLVKLSLSDLIDSNNQDPSRGYFVSLLGFDVDATHPEHINKTTLQQASELRQIGAVMHSSPLLITNYAKVKDSVYSNRQNYVVFGTTQGLLHVVDADSGVEKLAFVPNEMVENQKLAFVRPELSSGGVSHLFYGVDAPWVADTEYVLAPNDAVTVGKGLYEQEGRQVLYGGLRMGGKSYYALDLSDIDAPKLKFQIIPKGSCSSSNLIGCMGQSWSKPTIAWVNWKGYKKRVMFVGGGYDAEGNGTDASKNATDKYKGYEYEDYQQRSKIGAGVYMFDAETGELLWTASANVASNLSSYHEDLKYSVVSQIKTVDRNADGLVDHLYFGDLGGQVWRIDLNNTAGKNNANLFSKKPVRLLNLNKSANSPRFYEAPAFSTYSENGKIVAVISIGSGNRSKPLADYASDSSYLDDAIYNIYDKDVVRSDLFDVVENNYKNQNDQLLSHDISIRGLNDSNAYLYLLDDNNRFSKNSVYSSFENNAGWYYPFKKSRIQTEKVTDSPIVMNYRMYVNTFDASASGTTDQCGAGVAGGSFMTLFCMPFGQCGSGVASDYRLSLGSGMVGGSVGPLAEDALSRSLVTNTDISTKNSLWTDSPKTALKVRVLRWYERTQ
ncbi:PilC/PilY family type IV pilus protein [Acinetobacter gerneri]|uniref:PilC/PilY family type IV pilus protein n=1 Tax=Acinetobacter gerneri TaxID=202952 RepID=A0AAW8JIN4_9GAMM|nr:PilC/PilY family type IV pilus protein [Acinetobacter gerneri]MDQ9010590.1 PilC/PilY family type IV pilus protein [Acinetobacter gerneri]MDQ9014789.1 PilC/PilY family type IV pilus protein [Acinetobacter gerneri]MDQ9025960.1 PilC/PilY family type IV pilus protein [Acinetobacter gerneri]MDQ9053288.1 PilC/PilY family type IV pilus protein [Acinetobacter gerneri]MDQ9060906.1 PilC/PilY family type IV pilus protein [Acinetobacter gerneri]